MTKFFISALLISMLLASCANDDGQRNKSSKGDTTAAISGGEVCGRMKNANYFRMEDDSVAILPFEIKVSLSPKARDRMTKGGETIIVFVSFEGRPKDSSKAKFEEDGSFFVASSRREIQYGQVARFDNIKFSKAIYDQLADKDIDVDVNVASGRKSDQNNLLNCDPMFDKISNVVNRQFIVNGTLIYGDD